MKTARIVKLLLGICLMLGVVFGLAPSGFAQEEAKAPKKAKGPSAPVSFEQAQIDAMYKAVDAKKGPVDFGLTDPALIGAIDIHAHLEPTVERTTKEGGLSLDFYDFAKIAQARGLRGYVQKSHSDISSASNAYIVRQHVAPGLEVFGRFPMNLSTGGINLATVIQFMDIKGGFGRVVELPTWDAQFRTDNATFPQRAPKVEERPWLAFFPPDYPKWVVISKNGKLEQSVVELIDTLPKYRTADSGGRLEFATGHASPEEDILAGREANKVGLPMTCPHCWGDMSPAQLEEWTKLGGYIELRNSIGSSRSIGEAVAGIKKYGVEHFIISSDAGFLDYPIHTDCLVLIARAMRLNGITDKELAIMMKDNPAKFLGIPTLPAKGGM